MRTWLRTTHQLIQGGIQGRKRVQGGVIGTHGNSSNPGQHELGAQITQWECKSGIRLSRSSAMGNLPPPIPNSFQMQTLQNPQKHFGELPRLDVQHPLLPCEGASR